MRLQFKDQILLKLLAPDEIVLHVFPAPLFQQFAGIGFQRVDPRKRFRRRIVPGEQLRGLFQSPALLPARKQPFGMRPAGRGLGNFQIGQKFSGGAGFAQIAAQDGVHKSGLRPEAVLSGQFDGFVHGGMAGNTVEPENLVETEPQEILQGGFLFASAGFEGDKPVERGLPADGAIHDFLAKRAVGGRKLRSRQRVFQQILGKSAIGAPLL